MLLDESAVNVLLFIAATNHVMNIDTPSIQLFIRSEFRHVCFSRMGCIPSQNGASPWLIVGADASSWIAIWPMKWILDSIVQQSLFSDLIRFAGNDPD
jgi:hypothetical protein